MMLDQLDIEAHVNDPVPAPEMLIDGQWTTAIEGAETNITSPVDGSTLGTIASGSRADVDRAVTVARHAFDDGRWSACPPAVRKKSYIGLRISSSNMLLSWRFWAAETTAQKSACRSRQSQAARPPHSAITPNALIKFTVRSPPRHRAPWGWFIKRLLASLVPSFHGIFR